MSERFVKLDDLPQNLYVEGSPIIISAGLLLKDTVTGKIITQFKFKNISENIIKAVQISLEAFDVLLNPLPKVEEYQYLDISIKEGDYFGSDKAIIMSDSNCRSVKIKDITVILSNNSIWRGHGEDLSPIEMPKRLDFDIDAELLKQYQIATTAKAIFIPVKRSDYWICTCGNTNKSYNCTRCACSKEQVFSAYDISALTEAMNARLEQERIQKEREELERKKDAKRRKRKIASIMIVLAIMIATSFVIFVVVPGYKHSKAIDLMNAGQYDEAEDLFLDLNDYEMINECRYQAGVRAQTNKEYSAAYYTFFYLNSYKDSERRAQECAIAIGDERLSKNLYMQAADWYSLAGYTKGINLAKYQYVLSNQDRKNLVTYEYLKSLKSAGYEDADEIYSKLYAWNVTIIAVNNDSDSLENMESISKYDPVYIHFKVSGGAPDETITPYFEYTRPDGSTDSYTSKYSYRDGDTLWHRYGIYSNPKNGAEGILKVDFYTGKYFWNKQKIGSVEIVIGP